MYKHNIRHIRLSQGKPFIGLHLSKVLLYRVIKVMVVASRLGNPYCG